MLQCNYITEHGIPVYLFLTCVLAAFHRNQQSALLGCLEYSVQRNEGAVFLCGL